MDINLVDKLYLDNLNELENRDKNFRIVINHKIYDTSHEDDIAKFVINHTHFKDMLLIRFEYYLSKTYHGLGKGDMVFYDKNNDKLFVLELKSLKDKYSNISDKEKINKCIAQSTKYSEYTAIWCSKESTPVSIIELADGKIQIIERTVLTPFSIDQKVELNEEPSETILVPSISHSSVSHSSVSHSSIYLKNKSLNPWINSVKKKENDEIDNDQWFTHPGDQTYTKYRIIEDTLESERVVDNQPSSGSRRSFRKRVKKVCQECSKCSKYYIVMKDTHGNVLMSEMHDINEADID